MPQTDINAIPTASPVFVAADIINEVNPSVDHQLFNVESIGSRTLRDMITTGQDFGFSLTHYPYNLPLLKYISEPPNETTPAGTSAEYLGFLLSYKQAVGSTNTEHFVKFQGAKGNSLEISVSPDGLVEASSEWICREITLPNTTSGLTTPTFIEFASLTSSPLSHTDNGPAPLTLNAVAFPCSAFSINWNNNLIPDRYNGSTLIDALTVGNRSISGSFTIPVGKNLQLETKIRELQQAPFNGSYVFKTGVMVATITGIELGNYSPVINASNNETLAWAWSWTAKDASLGTT